VIIKRCRVNDAVSQNHQVWSRIVCTIIPCLVKSVVLKGLWTQLYYYPNLLSSVLDLSFDNDVQGKSAGGIF